MGYNTAVMVLNDRLHEIEKDPDFAQNLASAIRIAHCDPDRYAGGFSVLPPQHADVIQIVAVGCNSMRLLGCGFWRDDDHTLLKNLADDMGYRIVRKRKE